MIRKLAKPFALGIFLFGLSGIQAAPQTPDDDQGWYRNRDSFYQGEGWHMRFFDRVREDLNRVQAKTFSAGDEYRIARTKEAQGPPDAAPKNGGTHPSSRDPAAMTCA
jgi:hypothetical protein